MGQVKELTVQLPFLCIIHTNPVRWCHTVWWITNGNVAMKSRYAYRPLAKHESLHFDDGMRLSIPNCNQFSCDNNNGTVGAYYSHFIFIRICCKMKINSAHNGTRRLHSLATRAHHFHSNSFSIWARGSHLVMGLFARAYILFAFAWLFAGISIQKKNGADDDRKKNGENRIDGAANNKLCIGGLCSHPFYDNSRSSIHPFTVRLGNGAVCRFGPWRSSTRVEPLLLNWLKWLCKWKRVECVERYQRRSTSNM